MQAAQKSQFTVIEYWVGVVNRGMESKSRPLHTGRLNLKECTFKRLVGWNSIIQESYNKAGAKLKVKKWQIEHLKPQDQDQGSQPIIFSIKRFTFFHSAGEIAQLEKIGKPHPHFPVNHLFFHSECVVQSRINLCQIRKLKRPKNISVNHL